MVSVTLNSFLEDTAIFVAGAFLVVRGRVVAWLADDRLFGFVMGMIGASEVWLPNDRYPYAPHGLAVAFAVHKGGRMAGSVALAAILFNAAWATHSVASTVGYVLSAAIVGVIVLFTDRAWRDRPWGSIAAIGAVAVGQFVACAPERIFLGSPNLLQVPANAFAFALFAVVFRDADLRRRASELEREAENARRLAVESQLATVRSRIQPHFLFNTLNTIAALCTIAPSRAASATIRLSKIMRRSLDSDSRFLVSLRREMETVDEYIAIESERFMDKLRIERNLADVDDILIPAFSVQVLVENAILHGISRIDRPGLVEIDSRAVRDGWIVAVADDGLGAGDAPLHIVEGHGLHILDAQLRSRYGDRSRIRLYRRRAGVLATFYVPRQRR